MVSFTGYLSISLSYFCGVSNSGAQMFSHLPFQAEDKKTALAAGLSAAEKTDAHEEEELQAAEEVCGTRWPWRSQFGSFDGSFSSHPQPSHAGFHSQFPFFEMF